MIERTTEAQWQAAGLAYEIFGLSASVIAALLRVTEVTVIRNLKKLGFIRGAQMDPDDSRLERDKVLALADGKLIVSVARIKLVRKVLTEPLILPKIEGTEEELSERMGELQRIMQTKFLIRLMDGTLTRKELVAYESVSDDMRHYEKILHSMNRWGVKWKQEAQGVESIPHPTDDELKALMDKIENRIDELATRRAERLAAEKSQQEAGSLGEPGVDVAGTRAPGS